MAEQSKVVAGVDVGKATLVAALRAGHYLALFQVLLIVGLVPDKSVGGELVAPPIKLVTSSRRTG